MSVAPGWIGWFCHHCAKVTRYTRVEETERDWAPSHCSRCGKEGGIRRVEALQPESESEA